MAAETVDKRDGTQVVTLHGYFIGLPIESVQRAVVRSPSSVELTQIRGTLRTFMGRWTVRGGEDGTELLYHVEADPGIPMFTDDAARQFLVQYLERMLDRIKLAAERKPPSRRPRAAVASSVLSGGAPAEAADTEEEEEPDLAAGAGIPPAVPPAAEIAGQADIPAAAVSERGDLREPARVPPARHPAQGGTQAASTSAVQSPHKPGPGGSPSGRRRRRRRRRPGPGGPATGRSGPRPPSAR
jgi:hypothetical protein